MLMYWVSEVLHICLQGNSICFRKLILMIQSLHGHLLLYRRYLRVLKVEKLLLLLYRRLLYLELARVVDPF